MKQLLKNFSYGKDSELYWFVGLEGSLTLMQSFSTMLDYSGDMSVMVAAGGDGGSTKSNYDKAVKLIKSAKNMKLTEKQKKQTIDIKKLLNYL